MPYVVVATRHQGRWTVKTCPGCGRTHRFGGVGPHRARCGADLTLIGSGAPLSTRARTTNPRSNP